MLTRSKKIGKGSIGKVQENPCCLADDIWYMGFMTADSIAKNLGYSDNDPRRCRNGIPYTLNKLSDDEHAYAEREQLLKSARVPLLDKEPITEALDKMIEAEDLVIDEEAIFLPPSYYAECGVVNKLKKLIGTSSEDLFEKEVNIGRIVKKTRTLFDDVQVAAIKQAAESKAMVPTGGLDTGKATTTIGIIATLETMGQRVHLATPTGQAAKRMSEATGKEAKTEYLNTIPLKHSPNWQFYTLSDRSLPCPCPNQTNHATLLPRKVIYF